MEKLMNIRKILWMLCVIAAVPSCHKDETTDATGMISEITIDGGTVKDKYDIDKNETLKITPKVSQTMDGKPLAYTWEINQKVYSQEPELVYVGKELGTFNCRLVVENEDGKAFFPFTLNVNSPYEEGITVISRDAEGKSRLSFMLAQRTEGVADYFYEGDCFALNNPDLQFADSVADILLCNNSLLVACQGNKATGQPGTIYYLNGKTFVVENVLSVPEYEDFRPYRILAPSNTTSGSVCPVLCKNGKIYEFSTTEGAVTRSARFKNEYSHCCSIFDDGSLSESCMYLWDKNIQGLFALYRGLSLFCCEPIGKEWQLMLNESNENELRDRNYFKGYDLVFMFTPRVRESATRYGDRFVIITKKGALYQKTIFASGLWVYNNELQKNELADYDGMKMAGIRTDLTEETPYVASAHHKYLLYGNGNKVKRWIYEQQRLDQAKEIAAVGTEAAVITSMELSLDHEELYVAFYEPGEEGMNGHIWTIDAEEGNVLRKYDNVCYRPVKIIYKQK